MLECRWLLVYNTAEDKKNNNNKNEEKNTPIHARKLLRNENRVVHTKMAGVFLCAKKFVALLYDVSTNRTHTHTHKKIYPRASSL